MPEALFVPAGNRSPRTGRSSGPASSNAEVDPDAVRFLYERHARSVYRYLRELVGRDDAEDLTQQVFLKLITQLGRYEPRSDVPFSAWLRRVAHNLAVDYLRSARTGPVETTRAVHASADEAGTERARCLLEALAELPPSQREVVMLRYLAGLTPGEIASALGRSQDSVNCLHHRARGTLKRELTRRGAAPVTLARAA
jgi:RNA polymerase sigma-70 factor (ECF subfamily)